MKNIQRVFDQEAILLLEDAGLLWSSRGGLPWVTWPRLSWVSESFQYGWYLEDGELKSKGMPGLTYRFGIRVEEDT